MSHLLSTHDKKTEYEMTRRKFLWVTSLSAAGFIVGCATNPVTGKSQLMLMSESSEIQLDKQHSPHQFSADYGITQDRELNNYINTTGKRMAALTHRPNMPYSFNCVNATYVNAYAFPGGSIAATRGILLTLNNEAELAALLGHELGHVNARHTAEQMSKGIVTSLVVGIASAYVGTKYKEYRDIAASLGMVGAGMLLAYYSRDNEREADALGMEYMVRAGYGNKGFVGLMDMLQNLSKSRPSAIELMFSTHPMSEERYRNAVAMAQTTYRHAENLPLHRERYMDNTSRLRAIKGAIENLQKADTAMGKKQYGEAEALISEALQQAPTDYTALVMMSKCMMLQGRPVESQRYAEEAKRIYPQEAQANHMSGFAKIKRNQFAEAYEDFVAYEQKLPGNPNTAFYKGLALEGMRKIPQAANEYNKFLQVVQQGEQATYAYQQLVKWGYIKPQNRKQ